MYVYAHHGVVAALALTLALLSGCSSVSYQTEEWRVAVPEQGDAQAVVRYIGIGTASKDPAVREQMANKLKQLAEERRPSKGFAPSLHNVRRRVYMEGDKLVLEETGTLPNPLAWQQQSGLNPLTWFSGSPTLVTKDNHILKRDIDSTRNVIASDGQVMDEDTYTQVLRDGKPLAISTDTEWQRQADQAVPNDRMTLQEAEVIVWPRQARSFYWKVSGKGFQQQWQSLAREYEGVAAVEDVAPVTVTSKDRAAMPAVKKTSAPAAPAADEAAVADESGNLDDLVAPPVADEPAPAPAQDIIEPPPIPPEEAAPAPATDIIEPPPIPPEEAAPQEPPAPAPAAKADESDQSAQSDQPPAPTPKAAAAEAAPQEPPAPAREEEFPDDTPITPLSADDTLK